MNRTLAAVLALACAAAPAAAAPTPQTDAPTPQGETPAAPLGTLTVQAVQGTPDAPPITSGEVKVELYHRGMFLDALEAKLDEAGRAVFEVPLRPDVQPVVQIVYRDMTYQQPGEVMDARNPERTVEVACYEPTADEPDWSVQMWHVMADHAPGGLRVVEVLVVNNPAQRTWLGSEPAGGERAVTTAFRLPPGAEHVTLGRGFHDWCCTTAADGRLVNHLPLTPGTTEYKFAYHLPAPRGAATLTMTAPAPVAHAMAILPADVEVAGLEGLTFSAEHPAGERTVRSYLAGGLVAGDTARMQLAGLQRAAAADRPARAASVIRVVAGAGAGVLLAGAAAVFFLRPGRRDPQPAEGRT